MVSFRFRDRAKDKKRNTPPVIRGQVPTREQEVLTGRVRGMKASDDEERFARAFNKLDVSFQYQVPIYTALSLPGEEKQVDFVIRGNQPFEPRGFIGHYRTFGQEVEDNMREDQLNSVFRKIGWLPLKWAKFDEYGDTQETVDDYVRKVLL